MKSTLTFGYKLWKMSICPKRFKRTQLDKLDIQTGADSDVLFRPRTIMDVKRAMVARIMESR